MPGRSAAEGRRRRWGRAGYPSYANSPRTIRYSFYPAHKMRARFRRGECNRSLGCSEDTARGWRLGRGAGGGGNMGAPSAAPAPAPVPAPAPPGSRFPQRDVFTEVQAIKRTGRLFWCGRTINPVPHIVAQSIRPRGARGVACWLQEPYSRGRGRGLWLHKTRSKPPPAAPRQGLRAHAHQITPPPFSCLNFYISCRFFFQNFFEHV